MHTLIARKSITPGAIFCVGKNYLEHTRELRLLEGIENGSADIVPAEPWIFMKPPGALAKDNLTSIPSFDGSPLSTEMHYEVELVLLIDAKSDGCSFEEATGFIRGFGVGLDMTLRDVQLAAKKAGEPWLKSKGFKNSALVSDFVPFDEVNFPEKMEISLELNGTVVQRGRVADMLYSPVRLVHYLSYIYGLCPGDIVFTGTPAGVGRVVPGDFLTATLSGWLPGGEKPETLAILQVEVM
jgi:fumarylpyruvate hydrolase